MNLRKWIGLKLGRSLVNAIFTAVFTKSGRSALNAVSITVLAVFLFRTMNGEG